LALKDALGNTKFREIDEFLDAQWMHFRNSPTEWMGLNSTAEMLECRVIQPPKSSGTRFISFRYRALEALKINWAPLVFFYSNQISTNSTNSDKARGFLRYLLDGQFMARCWAYMDILSIASSTCKAIQASKNMNIAHALTKLAGMKVELGELKESAGENEQEIMAMFLDASPAEVEVHPTISTRRQTVTQSNNTSASVPDPQKQIYLPLKKLVRVRTAPENSTFLATEPIVVKSCSAAAKSVPEERTEAVTRIIEATAERFDEFEQNEHVLSHLAWLHVTSWPTASQRKPQEAELQKIREFQQDDVSVFIDHFSTPLTSANFSKQKALKQFKDLKITRALSAPLQEMESDAFWPYVYKTEKDKRDFFLVVELALALPFSEAVVESGFSAKGRILTDWRCSLSHGTLTDLLHFSTRKGDPRYCNSKKKHELITVAAEKFVSGKDGMVHGKGLSTRRINKLCKILEDTDSDSEEEMHEVETECEMHEVETECEKGEEKNSDTEMSESRDFDIMDVDQEQCIEL
jgi:hypothetical protein